MNLKYLMTVGLIFAGINCFANDGLDAVYSSMDPQDQERLLKICKVLKSGDASAKVNVMENATEFQNIIGELTKKYPELNFTNACGH